MLTEENFIDFKCPYCDASVSFPQESTGFLRECPSCMEALIVPESGAEIGGKIPLPITTPNLALRRFQPGDWKDLLEMFGSDAEEHVLQWLERDSHVRLTTPEQIFYLGIETQNGGKLIGYLGLKFTDTERLQATVTHSMNSKFEMTDLLTEAMAALLRFCFEGIHLHRVTAMCDSKDARHCELFEKIGMRREGEFVKDRLVEQAWASTIWYAVLEEEYRAKGEVVV